MKKKTTVDQLNSVLAKEGKKYTHGSGKLSNSLSKFSKGRISEKSSYSFPLKDTIGRTLHEQCQFRSF
jgi:hypothetical protein